MFKRTFFSAAAIVTATSALKCAGSRGDGGANNSAEQKQQAVELIERFMQRNGVPGLSVGISVNGKTVWRTGFGYADVEQLVPCTGSTVMRIASISKSITATIAAGLVEKGALDLDAPIKQYLPDYPTKQYKGVPVEITSRQLLCHTAGIRHYKEEQKSNDNRSNDKRGDNKAKKMVGEFYSNKRYDSVEAALQTFINDEVISKPGEQFNYTTNGYTLLSAVLEKVAEQSFQAQLHSLTHRLGMNHTQLDRNTDIIPNRTRYYFRDEHGILKNSPEVDNSNKWAGGGIISTVDDLLTFANAMLYSYNAARLPKMNSWKPLIGAETLRTFWKGEILAKEGKNYMYALGWYKMDDPDHEVYGGCSRTYRHSGYWMHTGGAVGASSVLLIKPSQQCPQSGICVAILTNLEDCKGLRKLALELGNIFDVDLYCFC